MRKAQRDPGPRNSRIVDFAGLLWAKSIMDEIIKALAGGADPAGLVGRALGLPAAEQEALFAAAGSLNSEAAARFLALVYAGLSDKRLQKLAKKALFLLGTKGVRTEAPRPAGESALHKVETEREGAAYLSNYDETLTRLLLVVVATRKNHFLFSHIALHFPDGLTEMQTAELPRNQLEMLIPEYTSSAVAPIVLPAISPPFAGYLVEEGARASGRQAEEARGINRMMSAVKGDVRKPEDIYLLDAHGAAPAAFEDVLNDSMFEPFNLAWPGIEEDKKKLDEAVNSGIVLPQYVVEERRQASLNALVAGGRLAGLTPGFKRMLADYAYMFYCLKRYDLYAGIAGRIHDEAYVKRALLHFVNKAFGRMKKEAEEGKMPGVIVDPYSAGKEPR